MRARTDQSASTRAKGPDGSVLNRPPEIRHAKTRTARSRTVDMARIITRKLCEKRRQRVDSPKERKGKKATYCEFSSSEQAFEPGTSLPQEQSPDEQFARVGVRDMVGYEAVQLMVSRQVGHEREVKVVLPRCGRGEDR
jgi:hypothetical protein